MRDLGLITTDEYEAKKNEKKNTNQQPQ